MRLSGMFFILLAAVLFALPNATQAQRKTTKAEKVSESQAPNSYQPGKQTTPSSDSKAPKKRRSSRVKSGTRFPFIMNVPRSPLRPSDRARYYGIGVVEIGLNAGTSHVITDVGGKPGSGNWNTMAFINDNVSYSTGLFVRYKINEWFGLAGGVDHAWLTASNPDGYIYTYGMNGDMPLTETVYSFTNSIYEMSLKMELHTPPFKNSGVGIYGFAGIAGYSSDPKIFDESNQAILIQDASQQVTPSPFSLALPIGGGVTIVVAEFVRVGLEIGYRYTANHGLDGAFVTNTHYDSFLYNTIRIGYVLPSRR